MTLINSFRFSWSIDFRCMAIALWAMGYGLWAMGNMQRLCFLAGVANTAMLIRFGSIFRSR